jgi:DNA-directed RNA polymerase subunit H
MSENKENNLKILNHFLVPNHKVLSKEEAKKIFELYNSKPEQFPYIMISDPVIKEIGAKAGDLIKIIRKSQTAGETEYYRLVVEG